MALWRPFDVPEGVAVENNVPLESGQKWEFVNKDLHVQSQRLILNVYYRLKRENNELSETSILTRIEELLFLPFSTIRRVIEKNDVVDHTLKRQGNNEQNQKIDEATKDLIRRVVYELYEQNKVPTLECIYQKLQDYGNYPYKSLTTLRDILRKCGFRYKKLDTRMAIMESSRIVDLRQEYLRKIRDYREINRNIVYLDETWFDSHDVVKYGWVDSSKKCRLDTPSSRGKRIIILHAGNENGFLQNALLLSAKDIKTSCADYHQDMNAELFEKWFKEQLIPNLPINSVIVMDNASYHSRQINKIPNLNSKKADILYFLKEKNIAIPEKVPCKKELIQIIKRYNFKPEHFTDNLAEQNGHTVLRLPPYYCVFNPIELIWSSVKNRLRKVNHSPTLNNIVVDSIRRVVNDNELNKIWKNSVAHVIKKEAEYRILPPVNPIVIQPGLDSSSDEFSE